MKLQLLDIEKFIQENHIKEVTSTNIQDPSNPSKFDSNGLWSEDIFGTQNTRQRRETFGYISLRTNIFHPAIYPILLSTNSILKKIIDESIYVTLDNNGILQVSDEKNGHTGFAYLISIFDKYDIINNSKTEKIEDAKFLEKNREKLIINKWLVIPPGGIRDINLLNLIQKRRIISSEINDLYLDLLNLVNLLPANTQDQTTIELYGAIVKKIQDSVNNIYNWVKNHMRGKRGLFRGAMLMKRTDYCARGVIGSDPNIPLGYIGLPWHLVLVIFEPFFFHVLLKTDRGKRVSEKIAKFLNVEKLEFKDLKQFSLILNRQSKTIPQSLKNDLIEIAKDIVLNKQVLYKRDPVVTRSNLRAGYVKVLEEGDEIILNPLDLVPLQGDSVIGCSVELFSNIDQIKTIKCNIEDLEKITVEI